MSYYNFSPYSFSYHALDRIKDRLNLKNLNEWQIKDYCLKLIKESFDVVETKSFLYIKINKSNLYFVIKKEEKLILTISPMSASKLLDVIEKNL